MLRHRLLLSAEGDGAPGAGGVPTPTPTPPAPTPAPTPAPAAAWYAPAESLKTSDPETWSKFQKSIESGGHKDFASVVKHVVGLEGKLGSAITLPGKEAKPEEIAAARSKLVAAGLLPAAPPESPDKYDFKLDAIPEAMRDTKTIDTVRAWAHKHGLSNDAVKELAEIEQARYTGTVEPALKFTNEQGRKAVEEFATSVGKEPAEVLAYAGNWLAKHFSEEDVKAMESAGFANSPVAIKFAARAGLDTGEDISVLGSGPLSDSQFEEATKFTRDPSDPDYKLWFQGDQADPKRIALKEKYDQAFMRKYGTGSVA